MSKQPRSSGISKGKEKQRPPPSINTIILKKLISLYERYCHETHSSTCIDIVKGLKGCLEDDGHLSIVCCY